MALKLKGRISFIAFDYKTVIILVDILSGWRK